jgi:hypothetical protein
MPIIKRGKKAEDHRCFGKDVEKLELLYTVVGIIEWCSSSGK